MSEPRQVVNLGRINDPDAQRDAIHIAVLPCVAGVTLRPGQHVGLDEHKEAVHENYTAPLGIVDPFLRRPVMKGQRFNLLLYPNTITSLRHEWTHPQIDQN